MAICHTSTILELCKRLVKSVSNFRKFFGAQLHPADRLSSYDRRNKGRDYEKEGKVHLAVKQYEKNVAEMCYLPASYQRLRIIYTKRKQYDDALRVCRAYLRFLDAIGNTELHSSLA